MKQSLFFYPLLVLLACLFVGQARAHGDEEHKDHAHAAPSAVLETNAAVPSIAIQSDQFELVARLYSNELGLYIDRWASNVPVLNAEVEVEFKGKKAVAKFHADHGDYAVADPDMLKALHEVGEHDLLFTIVAGKDADLLTGVLHVEEVSALDALSGVQRNKFAIGAIAALLLLGCGLGVWQLLRARKEEQA